MQIENNKAVITETTEKLMSYKDFESKIISLENEKKRLEASIQIATENKNSVESQIAQAKAMFDEAKAAGLQADNEEEEI